MKIKTLCKKTNDYKTHEVVILENNKPLSAKDISLCLRAKIINDYISRMEIIDDACDHCKDLFWVFDEIKIKTNDYFYGNYSENKVRLRFSEINNCNRNNSFRVAVWGNDDFGMFKDFEHKQEAKKCFTKVKNCEVVSKQFLFDLNFKIF